MACTYSISQVLFFFFFFQVFYASLLPPYKINKYGDNEIDFKILKLQSVAFVWVKNDPKYITSQCSTLSACLSLIQSGKQVKIFFCTLPL